MGIVFRSDGRSHGKKGMHTHTHPHKHQLKRLPRRALSKSPYCQPGGGFFFISTIFHLSFSMLSRWGPDWGRSWDFHSFHPPTFPVAAPYETRKRKKFSITPFPHFYPYSPTHPSTILNPPPPKRARANISRDHPSFFLATYLQYNMSSNLQLPKA